MCCVVCMCLYVCMCVQVHQLREQQQLFLERFAEFESTLQKSDSVVKQLQVHRSGLRALRDAADSLLLLTVCPCVCVWQEREAAMAEAAASLRTQHAELKAQAEQEDVQLIAAVELGRWVGGCMGVSGDR